MHACYSTVIDKEEMWIKETTAQLEKKTRLKELENIWKTWNEAKKKHSATQSGMESDCSSPMIHKERRGLSK